MQRYIDEDLTPGVITAIVRKGKLVHFSAQGDMDVKLNPCGRTPFFELRR